jgi:hypothetical protein
MREPEGGMLVPMLQHIPRLDYYPYSRASFELNGHFYMVSTYYNGVLMARLSPAHCGYYCLTCHRTFISTRTTDRWKDLVHDCMMERNKH